MERSTDTRFRTGRRAATGAVVLLMAGCGVTSGGGEGATTGTSSAASASATGGTSGLGEHATSPATHASPRGLIGELVDNHNGAPVYADNTGKPVAGNLPGRIPYGTEVPVACYDENASGITSVTAFYEIGGGKWAGNVVVSDVMTNGGPLGNTNTPNVDPAVPAC